MHDTIITRPRRIVGYAICADYIPIRIDSLRSKVRRGTVPYIRIGPRHVLFDLDVIDAWIAAGTHSVTSASEPE